HTQYEQNHTAWQDVTGALNELDGVWLGTRGNHDPESYYSQYVTDEDYYSYVHEGIRFISLEGPGPLSRDDEPCVLHGIPDEQLTWIEDELQQAQAHGQNVVMHLHASPWEENSQGGACYIQIGDGRDELVNLM